MVGLGVKGCGQHCQRHGFQTHLTQCWGAIRIGVPFDRPVAKALTALFLNYCY